MRRLLIAAASFLFACGGEDDANVPYSAPETEPPAAAPSRSDCVEDDFVGDPLAGPGYDESGTYTGPTDQPLLASSSVLYLLDGPDILGRFTALLANIMVTANQSEGLLGVALGASPACGAYRTLAVWQDEAALRRFVGSEAHIAAMVATREIAEPGTVTTYWSFDPAVEAIDWAAGMAHTAAGEGFE